jgi:hypothetical protein
MSVIWFTVTVRRTLCMSIPADTSLANLQFCAVDSMQYANGGLRYGFYLKAKSFRESIVSLSREYSVSDRLLCPLQNVTITFHWPYLPKIWVLKLSLLRADGLFNPLSPELNSICYLLALLAHEFFDFSRMKVKSLTLRLLMSYIYIYGAPTIDVSRSHTTTHHSR